MHSTAHIPSGLGASARLTPRTFAVHGNQTRGGRKGGLPERECNGAVVKANGTLPSGSRRTIREDVPDRPKQFMGQLAINVQQPSMVFSEGSFLCGQQSMSSIEADMSSAEDDIDMAVDFTAATAPLAAGSMATAIANKKARRVRPKCICKRKIADLRVRQSSYEFGEVPSRTPPRPQPILRRGQAVFRFGSGGIPMLPRND